MATDSIAVRESAVIELSSEQARPSGSNFFRSSWFRLWARFFSLCGLSLFALLIHGYHPGAEDAAIYLPAIKKDLNGALYPFGSEFFMSHAGLTLFDDMVAWSVRITHCPFDLAILIWHLSCTFLLLKACMVLGEKLFAARSPAWTGTALVASLLTLPVTGTALLIMDPYLTPRSISTPAVLFAVIAVLNRSWLRAAACLILTALVHPLMMVYGLGFCCILLSSQSRFCRRSGLQIVRGPGGQAPIGRTFGLVPALALSLPLAVHPVTSAYHAALLSRPYFFVTNWAWYEWLGVVGPLAAFLIFGKLARRYRLWMLASVCRTAAVVGVLSTIVSLVLCSSPRFESVAELQPMRAFHLLYVLFFLIAGGMLGRFVLRGKPLRLIAFFVPICACMFLVQGNIFPADAHIEWPGAKPRNPWVDAFVWIRNNTPQSAVFAIDPEESRQAGEDNQGFRAIAERSMLADNCKDAGVVTMFPALAANWTAQVKAHENWQRFNASDLARLSRLYKVSWVLLAQPGIAQLNCPYRNQSLLVCQVP